MKTHNPENVRVTRDYLDFLREARGQSPATADAVAAAIHRFEEHTGFRSFKSFRREQAISFKAALLKQVNGRTGERLAKASIHPMLRHLRAFFEWLSREPGFRSCVHGADAQYFNLTDNDVRTAKAERETPTPSLEQIRRVLEVMPAATAIERRDRALIAFTLLTGARVSATASFRLKHIDLAQRKVEQDPREVRTKRRKSFTTTFFPVGDDIAQIVIEWVEELTRDHLFGPDDPLFPATLVTTDGNGLFSAGGLGRVHWTNAGPIRPIFKRAFAAAGLPYFNPHSFRKTLARLGERLCPNPEAFKAWSQNIGHDEVMTTLTSYGQVAAHRQSEIILSLADAHEGAASAGHIERQLEALLAAVRRGA